jgi:hypothetical protein
MADTQPQPLQGSQGAGIGSTAGAAATPSLTPPPTAVGVGASGGSAGSAAAGTVWNNNKTINALWGIAEDRNSWAGVANVGWVKLSTASDSGIVALTALAAHGYQTQHLVNYRTESDGLIHEIYAW